MATVGDGLCVIGVALIFFAMFSPIMFSEIFSKQPSDYEICIRGCDKNMASEYESLECPKMCAEMLDSCNKDRLSNSCINFKMYNRDFETDEEFYDYINNNSNLLKEAKE